MVTKKFGESAVLQWNIEKENELDELSSANLFLLGPVNETLFILNPTKKNEVFETKEKGKFGERMKAEIVGGKTYLVTLENLTYADTNNFQLVATVKRNLLSSNPRSEIIHLFVGGMERNDHLLLLLLLK